MFGFGEDIYMDDSVSYQTMVVHSIFRKCRKEINIGNILFIPVVAVHIMYSRDIGLI